MKKLYLDFDGTVVEHMFPIIGQPIEGVISFLQKLVDYEVILNTARSDYGFLKESILYLQSIGINIIKYTKTKIYPPKFDIDSQIKNRIFFIDDICEGIPLKKSINGNADFVDWIELEKIYIEKGIL